MIIEDPSLRLNAKDAFWRIGFYWNFINDSNNIYSTNFVKEKNIQSISF